MTRIYLFGKIKGADSRRIKRSFVARKSDPDSVSKRFRKISILLSREGREKLRSRFLLPVVQRFLNLPPKR